MSDIPVLGREQIAEVASPALVFAAVRAALIAHAAGHTTVPAPLHLAFPEAAGDCHVKAGWIDGTDDFTVKIAAGFYDNGAVGLPSNHGLLCVLSARTGEPRAILVDGGVITARRTAAAGALVTHAMARDDATTLGLFGTGEQAELQAQWLALLRPVHRVLVHGRNADRAAALCRRLGDHGLDASTSDARATAGADIVVTTTPATAPVLDAGDVGPGTHVTGVGTDMPHKHELPVALLARAASIATDDHDQCLHHGDFGHAVRAGVVDGQADTPVGAMLAAPPPRARDAITVADLTGVGALDAAVASRVTDLLLGG